ncbi:hypothetical protein BDZ94DRAFT_1203198 [Collybia nuda]|uniref:Uncharacterized protein n=1 Tax=Collybia nuda TaxID=64659 RepID=A0A9P5XWV4_9AGAR|nr:hypothetical protein BDZ94DRAFT_1203198 [Collybia nuda]
MQRLACRVERFARSYSSASPFPWFVDQSPVPPAFTQRPSPPHLPQRSNLVPTLPANTPQVLRDLHVQLSQSPHLEPSTLVISQPLTLPSGPPLTPKLPQGRRRRGGTYPGESMYDVPGGIWNWVVMAQVKEGTEKKGAIESVVRVIRKTLLSIQPPLPIPPNSKRRMHNGWAMIDVGDFAVHVVSKEAKEKYFNTCRSLEW